MYRTNLKSAEPDSLQILLKRSSSEATQSLQVKNEIYLDKAKLKANLLWPKIVKKLKNVAKKGNNSYRYSYFNWFYFHSHEYIMCFYRELSVKAAEHNLGVRVCSGETINYIEFNWIGNSQ
jgi:hypothetical protein